MQAKAKFWQVKTEPIPHWAFSLGGEGMALRMHVGGLPGRGSFCSKTLLFALVCDQSSRGWLL